MEHSVVLPQFDGQIMTFLMLVLASAFIGLLYGIYLVFHVLKKEQGTPKMIEVATAIQEGASAYLNRQTKLMGIFILILAVGIFFIYKGIYDSPKLYWGISIAFLMGSIFSALTGRVGMWVAVRGNVRTAHAARSSFKDALEIAFQAGTVTGMFTVGTGLLGATIILLIFQNQAMQVLLGFGFGGSLVALFMRVGGGIFTKAADVGADLVGKIEAGIPEDDPRNAATIADNVGDNVGDCAGMAADIFESYEVTLVAAMILGATYSAVPASAIDQMMQQFALPIAAKAQFHEVLKNPGIVTTLQAQFPEVAQNIANFAAAFKAQAAARSELALKMIIFPLLVRAVGVFASIIGTMAVRGKEHDKFNPMNAIQIGFLVSAVVSVIGFGTISYFYFATSGADGGRTWGFFWATFSGIVLAIVISLLTQYYTDTEFKPVKEVARATQTGPATTILTGFAEGLESTVWSVVAISVAIVASGWIFPNDAALAAYSIALCGMGMLTTTGIIVSMDSYGPISDNANGIYEMAGLGKLEGGARGTKIIARLDAVGNTTKALTKGFAIASAVVAAVSLFRSFCSDVDLLEPARNFMATGVQVNLPNVFVGLLLGGAAPFLFSSIAIRAVSRAAFGVVQEVRRQFREIPGIMEGTGKPEYYKCVDIATNAAQRELIAPGLLAILLPMIVGFSFGVEALGGFLAGIIVTGQLLAVMLSNAGGAWDNAKKTIEDGLYGGKGSDAHKAGVIGDTVGDPFKDTAGPALNPLIKVMNLVSLMILPLLVGVGKVGDVKWVFVGVGLVVLTVALWMSKRPSKFEIDAHAAIK